MTASRLLQPSRAQSKADGGSVEFSGLVIGIVFLSSDELIDGGTLRRANLLALRLGQPLAF